MTITDRRRALMGAKKAEPPKENIFPSCQNWNTPNSSMFVPLGDTSFKLIVSYASTWKNYCYATRTLTKKYSDLVGKTLVIDFAKDDPNSVESSKGLGVTSNPNFLGGVTDFTYKKDFNSGWATLPNGHRHKEIVIGTDFVTTYTNYYLSFYIFAYSTTAGKYMTVTDFICYVK
jgi:hypothetical protein